jgi:DNA polymerase-1
VPVDKQTEYAVEDADITLQLKNHFVSELASEEVVDLFTNIELPLVNVLAAMESAGIRIDVGYLDKLAVQFRKETAVLEEQIYKQAGERFNLASPKQLGPILFDKLKLVDKPKKTKTGQYSTAEDVLSYLSKDHAIVADILEWRSVKKLSNTYIEALPEQVNPKTDRVHTIFNQAVAATGRLSSNHPNLQNIPIRTERGQLVRKAFVPRDEECLTRSGLFTNRIACDCLLEWRYRNARGLSTGRRYSCQYRCQGLWGFIGRRESRSTKSSQNGQLWNCIWCISFWVEQPNKLKPIRSKSLD